METLGRWGAVLMRKRQMRDRVGRVSLILAPQNFELTLREPGGPTYWMNPIRVQGEVMTVPL